MFSKVSFLAHALTLLADQVKTRMLESLELSSLIFLLKSTQSKFANDIIVSRQIFQRYCSKQQRFLSPFLLLFLFFLFSLVSFPFLKQKIYILIHIRLCGRVGHKQVYLVVGLTLKNRSKKISGKPRHLYVKTRTFWLPLKAILKPPYKYTKEAILIASHKKQQLL